MAYGIIKIDTITFTDGGIDKSVSISGLVQNPTFTGNITVTGTVSGNTVRGQTISGVTITGTTAQFTSGTLVSLTGTTIQGTTATYTTGSFTSLTGTTTSGTTANFVSGVFSTQISGATVTGTTANFTSGNFTNISGGTHTITSGVFAAGTAANPSISFTSDPNTGIYSPGADQVAISTNGTGRLFVDASGNVGVGISPAKTIDAYVTGTAQATLRLSDVDSRNVELRSPSPLGALAGVGTVTNHDFTFFINNTERARLDTSGRLGLGTSSPSGTFTVYDSGNQIVLNAPTSSNANITFQENGSNKWIAGYVPSISAFRFSNGSSDVLSLTNTGLVGIGTSTVNTTLEVLNSSAPIIRVGDGTRHMELRGGSTTQNAAIGTNYAGGFDIIQNGSAAVTIDTSKRLLVGTSSTSSNTTLLLQGYSGTTGPGVLRCCTTTNGPTSTEDLGYIMFGDATHVNAAWIQAQRDGGTWTAGSSYPGRLVFSTTADGASSPTERMRITSAGSILAFASSANDGITAGIESGAGATPYLFAGVHSRTGTASGGTLSYYVSANGDVRNTNNSYGAISDIKLKENVVDAVSQWDDIKALQVRKYNFKEEAGHQTHTQIGLIAQEVELVSPGLVSESPDRDEDGNDLGTVTKSVNYSVLYMKAVKALQEAMERIEALEQRLTDAGIA